MDTHKRILFFDGTCVLCNGLFQFIIKRDTRRKFHFGLIQDPIFDEMIGALPERYQYLLEQKFTSVIFLEHDKVYLKSTAAIKVITSLGGMYKLGYIAFIIPPILRDYVYDIIARNRYKWFGQQSCVVPGSDMKDRFIS